MSGTGGKSAVHPLKDLKRLVLHWPVYTGSADLPLMELRSRLSHAALVYLQNTLHAEDAQWGQWNAIVGASAIPTFMLFGLLCQKLPLNTLLLWGTVVAVPQMVPLLFIHSVSGALIAAVPIGLMGGVATAAPPLDLLGRKLAGSPTDLAMC